MDAKAVPQKVNPQSKRRKLPCTNGLRMLLFLGWFCISPIVAWAQATSVWTGNINSDWGTPGNWTNGLPGSSDMAEFNSYTNAITFSSSNTSVGQMYFSPNFTQGSVFSFTITSQQSLSINGAGVIPGYSIYNDSTVAPIFAIYGRMGFNSGTIGGLGAQTLIIIAANGLQGSNGFVEFNNSSSAGNAGIVSAGELDFNQAGTAGSALITAKGPFADIAFNESSTAEGANITLNYGQVGIGVGSPKMEFNSTSTAGNATITSNGGQILFNGHSTAGNATITTNDGGVIFFQHNSTAGNASLITNGSGTVDLSFLSSNGMTAGSIAGSGTYTLAGKTLTVGSNNTDTTVSGSISGGPLIKVGTGTFTLSGSNNLSSLSINGGTVEAASGNVLTPNSLLTVNSGGTFLVDTFVIANFVADSGRVTLQPNAQLEVFGLSGSGVINLLPSTLGMTAVAVEAITPDSTFSGTLQGLPAAGSTTGLPYFALYYGTLHMTGITTLYGYVLDRGGTLDLDSSTALSNNTFLEVASGTVVNVNGVNLATAGLAASITGEDGAIVLNGGSLTVELPTGVTTVQNTFGGDIPGTGSFGINGAGITQILSGVNTYTGATNITAGTLVAGSNTALSPSSAFTVDGKLDLGGFSNAIGSLAGTGTITNNGGTAAVLTVGNDNTSTTFSGSIVDGASSLGLTKIGSGTLTLDGAGYTYSGNTTVNGGTVNITGALPPSAVTVNSGGTLEGTGTINGAVNIASGATLAPGIPSTIGTLTVGSLTLNSGSILNYRLGVPNHPGGTFNDLVAVNGNLTLAGTLNVTSIGGFGEGVYELFTYKGILTNHGLNLGTLPAGFTDSELLLVTNQANQIDLLVRASGYADQFWDGTITSGSGTVGGGSGTWNNTAANWANADGAVNAPWQRAFAIFEGAAGAVTLGDNIDFSGMQFVTTGYVITAGSTAFELTATQTAAAGGTIINVDPNVTATIEAPIVGPGEIVKTNSGTLILTGNNTYSGGTTISGGILQLGNGGNSGSIVGNVTDSGVLAINRSDTYMFSGNISGSGGFEQIGTGTVILSGDNTYTGTTAVSRGTLQAGSSSSLSSNSTFTVNGTLDLHGFSSTIAALTGAGRLTNNGTSGVILTLGSDDSTTTFNGTLSDGAGSLGLMKTGTGRVILSGKNTYSGGTTVNAGTLQLGNGGTTGSIIGKVTDEGTLVFDRNDAYAFRGAISGRGDVQQSGTGTLTLSGTNTYSGGTTINSGTLIVDNTEALGRGDVSVTGGVLTADPRPINVLGNYSQGPNGALQLVIAGASPGQYDFLNVTGNASLGGTLKLTNQSFTPQAGDILTLVKASGAIANKFANFIDPFTTRPGLNTIDLVYSLHTVDLEFLNILTLVTPPPPSITTLGFASFAQTPNELAAGELLGAVELNPRFSNLLNFFLAQPFGDIPGELALIGSQSFTSFYEISYSDANIQRLTLENRLEDIRAGSGSLNEASTEGGPVGLQRSSGFAKDGKNPVEPVLRPARRPAFDLWASGFGDFVHVDSDYNARGYRFTTSGFDLGFDYRFLDHFAVGVMGNYTYTWTDLRPGTITVNSGRGGVYAGYFTGGYYINAGVYGGYNTYDTSRHGLGGIATGNTDGQEWSGFVSTGYDFHIGRALGLAEADHGDLTIGPIAAIQYTNVYVNNFSETGSLLPLNIHSDSEESLRSDLGFRAYYQWHAGNVIVAPYLKATWEHEFKYSALPITAGLAEFPGPNATFVGPVEGQDSAVISVGLSVQWTRMISTYASYDGQLGRGRYSSNAVTGGVRVSW